MKIRNQVEQVQQAWSSAKELHGRVEQELEALGMLIRTDLNQLAEH